MDFEQELKRIAEGYKGGGYEVTIHPKPNQLPPFAKDFQVDIVAKRGDGGVLMSVKRNRQEMQADKDMPRYAEVIGAQPGWRFDFAILEQESQQAREVRGAAEPSPEQVSEMLAIAHTLAEAGYLNPAVVVAWGGVEATMRRRLLAEGEEVGWGTTPRDLLSQIYSSGIVSAEELARLQTTLRQRNVLVHGFEPPPTEPQTVQFLIDLGKRLLEESRAVQQPA
jgi:hypothetical protein